MITEHHIPDPVTGGTLSGQAHGDGPITWVAIHPSGLVEWIGDEQDMRETRARLAAERDQHRTRLDELVNEYPELKSRSRRTLSAE